MNDKIKRCTSETEILTTYETLKELRPHLKKEPYVPMMQQLLEEGAHLIGAFNDEGVCLGVAVFRIRRLTVVNGKKEMYVDDLVTIEKARSQGVGKILMDWLKQEAKHLGCIGIALDSGLQRLDAHRFYEREGFAKPAWHFVLKF